MPGVPRIIHNEAFLPNDPMGSHLKNKKYPKDKVSKMGRRTKKRKRWNNRYDPEGWVGTGKNGAMPDPSQSQCLLCLAMMAQHNVRQE